MLLLQRGGRRERGKITFYWRRNQIDKILQLMTSYFYAFGYLFNYSINLYNTSTAVMAHSTR